MKKSHIHFIVIIILFIIVLYTMFWINQKNVRFVMNMGSGINLGNSLDTTRVKQYKPNADVYTYETFWNNPPITSEIFDKIKDAGFKTVRIPVSWDEHLDNEGNIDILWLNRVKEVVLNGISKNLYVILDMHHESWLVPTKEKEKENTRKLCKVWEQIAKCFINTGDKLLFESMNEPRLIGSENEWNGGNDEMRGVVNRLNAAFVNTIREVGGANNTRYLLLPTYGSSHYDNAIDGFVLPNDKRLIVAIHSYIPYHFALDENGTDKWNATDLKDTEEIMYTMKKLNRRFVIKGTPVMITEFACVDKNNLKQRIEWTEYYTDTANRYNIGYIWWDSGGSSPLIDRFNNEWLFPELVKRLTGKN